MGFYRPLGHCLKQILPLDPEFDNLLQRESVAKEDHSSWFRQVCASQTGAALPRNSETVSASVHSQTRLIAIRLRRSNACDSDPRHDSRQTIHRLLRLMFVARVAATNPIVMSSPTTTIRSIGMCRWGISLFGCEWRNSRAIHGATGLLPYAARLIESRNASGPQGPLAFFESTDQITRDGAAVRSVRFLGSGDRCQAPLLRQAHRDLGRAS